MFQQFWKNSDGEKRTYFKIVSYALILHIAYIITYAVLSLKVLAVYNVLSSLFYILMLFLVNRGNYKITMVAVHAEIIVFVAVSVFFGASNTGTGMYLLAMASMVYFCPFEHKYISYLLAVTNCVAYVVLRICSDIFVTQTQLTGAAYTFMHVFTGCGSFLIILLSAFFTDLSAAHTKAKLTEEKENLTTIINYDRLTGLQSRYMFTKNVKRLSDDDKTTIVIGDIDNFKDINNTYGHQCGNYVLQTAAEIIRNSFDLKRVDICRWNEEKFVFMFHDSTEDNAYENIEALRKKIEQHEFIWENKTLHITITFGLFSAQGKIDTGTFEKADSLLNKGKTDGKNIVVIK